MEENKPLEDDEMRTRVSYAKKALGAIVITFVSQGAMAWTAEGVDENWSFEVPGKWFGGNYYQIMERVNDAVARGEDDELYTQILQGLAREARGLDAILLHLETSSETGGGDGSVIKINTSPLGGDNGFPPIEMMTGDVLDNLARRFQSKTPGATGFEILQHQNDLGNSLIKVAWVSIRIIAEGGDRYEGLILMYRADTVTTFSLAAPYDIAGLRLEEMWEMARRIRFANGDQL